MAVYVSSKVILNSKEVLRIFIIESSRLYMSPSKCLQEFIKWAIAGVIPWEKVWLFCLMKEFRNPLFPA